MTTRYLTPSSMPPSQDDYNMLYKQFLALILATGKTSATIDHDFRHPLLQGDAELVIEKDVGPTKTTYTVVRG